MTFDDVELDYEIRGSGDPVVLLHASAFVRWYAPLVEHLRPFSVLRYRRDLAGGAAGALGPRTAAEDAAVCARLLDHLGWPTAHVVGHSYGALVGLELATHAPGRVRTVALLEPALRDVPSAPQVVAGLQPVVAAYRAGDKAGAVDAFLRTVCGEGYRAVLERALPGAFDDAVAQADVFFRSEMPAVQGWGFGADDARRVTQPILNMVGAATVARFVEGSDLVQSWFPRAERLAVPGTGHLLMVENPTAVADGLRAFFSRRPIGDPGRPTALSR